MENLDSHFSNNLSCSSLFTFHFGLYLFSKDCIIGNEIRTILIKIKNDNRNSIYDFKRLTENTKKFKKNIELKQSAVSNFNGYSKLYKSETGVNDSIIDKVSKDFDKIKVIKINDILKKFFSNFKNLDILKIDTEGCERVILKSIDKKYFKKIRIINIEGSNYNNLVPKYFRYSFNASASRFENTRL